MSDEWHIQVGTPEEARGDYEHDLQKQREVDAMKTYRVIMVSREFYEFDVEAGSEYDARTLAVQRMESGDWGRPVEFAKTEIFDMEVVK